MRKQNALWATLLLVAAMVVLTGCAPRAGAGTEAAMAAQDPNQLTIDLPAIVIDFDTNGAASIGGMSVSQLGSLAGADLSGLAAIDPNWVNYFTATNIQHMQVNNGADGLQLLVNGEPIPSLVWDGESLQATAKTAESLGYAIPLLEKVLPLVQRLGVGAIVRFPVPAGQEPIPLVVEGDDSAATAARQAQEEFLAAVGSPPKVNLPVVYQADGSFSVGDLTDAEWTVLTGAPWTALRLDPTLLQNLSATGVESMGFRTDTQGIHVSVNGQDLPYISWDGGEAVHVLDLSQQMGLWNAVMPGMNMDDIFETVKSLLPVIQTTDANITIYLP